MRAGVVKSVSGNFLGFSPEFPSGIIIVVVISMAWVVMAAHKEKCLAFSLDLPCGSKSLRASPNGLARSKNAGSH